MILKGPFTNTYKGGGPDAKKGAPKICDPFKGGPEKNYHKFSSKNWVNMLFYGVDP